VNCDSVAILFRRLAIWAGFNAALLNPPVLGVEMIQSET
jgi:hypothetical protein